MNTVIRMILTCSAIVLYVRGFFYVKHEKSDSDINKAIACYGTGAVCSLISFFLA